jgi:hypothetical protein
MLSTFSSLSIAVVGLQVFGVVSAWAGVDFFNPIVGGGSMLNNVGNGLGEPLNVIISALSSPAILTNDGILKFGRAIGFSQECLGLHAGNPQSANLGDGNGFVNEAMELRQDYFDPIFGTCLESIIGGNHFRVYRQNGPTANSSALFLAVSQEEDLGEHHNIVANGYDFGRDAFVARAVGTTSFGGTTYWTTARYMAGLLAPGSVGVNHGISTDGITALLHITIRIPYFWRQRTLYQGRDRLRVMSSQNHSKLSNTATR